MLQVGAVLMGSTGEMRALFGRGEAEEKERTRGRRGRGAKRGGRRIVE